MSDTDENQQGNEPEDHNIRQLREKAEKVDEATARALAAERKLAILESGIDAETELGKFFIENYQGDISDVSALKEAAQKLSVPFKGATSAEAEQETGGEAETSEPTGSAERQALATGSPADTGTQEHPMKRAQDVFDQAMKDGETWEQAAGLAINALANAAEAGDPRAIVGGQVA